MGCNNGNFDILCRKTKALSQFCKEVPEIVYHTATAEDGDARNLASALCRLPDLSKPTRDFAEIRAKIADAIGAEGFLIVDEGQYLCRRNHRRSDNWEALEWLMRIAEYGCFELAICGDLRLLEALRDAPQLVRHTPLRCA